VMGEALKQQYDASLNPIPGITEQEFAAATAAVNANSSLTAAGSVAGGKVTSGYANALSKTKGISEEQIKEALIVFEADKPENGGAGKLGENQKKAFAKALKLAGVTDEEMKAANKRFDNTKDDEKKAEDGGGRIGKKMKDGMKKPIENSGDLDRAIKGAVDRAIEAGRKAADEHSPSRRTEREIGLPMMQGIALGISRNADLVDSEMDRILARVSSASVDMSGIVSAMNSIPTQVNAVAPDGRPIEISGDISVVMQHDPNATPAEVQEQGKTIGQAIGREVIASIRGV
jgi:hypothetical protein